MPLKTAADPRTENDRHAVRLYDRDVVGLLQQLEDGEAGVRRWAARDLGRHPGAVDGLVARLSRETVTEVREAILGGLLEIGSDAVAEGLLSFLRSEDAALRNGAVAVLQQLPDAVGAHMETLLRDPDSDVRIMAIDILQALAHRQAPYWLGELLEREQQVNVAGVAIDRLAEIGTPDLLPVLADVSRRFADEPYIQFAIDTAVRRITGGSAAD